MAGPLSAYFTAFFGMAFAAASAFTLIYAVSHLDAPDRP